MIARKALRNIISITTDNGCEFLDPDKIKSVVGCNVYYTRAYASWEKGSVENCNKLVRRWYPKGTDFAKCTTAEMLHLEKIIYHIGNFSRLDYQQAKVDFNADSAQYLRQQEAVISSRIALNELMAEKEVSYLFEKCKARFAV